MTAGVLRRAAVIVLEAMYAEIADVLGRPKFARVLTDDRQREILELLSAAA